MPNALAFLALLSWPLVTVILFRRLPLERALVWTLLGGYLFLPPVAEINLPAIPAFDKMSIPSLSAYLVCLFMLKQHIPLIPEGWTGRALLALFVLSPFGTVLTNAESIVVNFRPDLPGMRLYDALSIVSYQAYVIMTFAMARRFLATASALREILIALVIAGLIYSVPMLIEIRLSPQINVWIYGFFQHAFDQMMRQGGFRPIVFLQHGLWVAFFAMTALLAAVQLAREAEAKNRLRRYLVVLYLLVLLVLSKSIGALIYGVLLLPLVWLLPTRHLLLIALSMAVFTLSYPVLRAVGAIPVDWMVETAARFSADRAQSLGYRFTNEGLLLAHAWEKPLFGWGGWLRNLLHDPLTGRVATIADGQWIITLTLYGWSGFVAEFGLMALPLVLLAREAILGRPETFVRGLGALGVIHGVNMVDMLPNATLTPLTWMICGALLGHAEQLRRERVAKTLRNSQMNSAAKTLI